MMDDSGFKSTRLSLMIISIGIIIFILGGGTINSANIFFGSITLEDTTPVKITAVLIYIYMVWRYWLYKYQIMGNFGEEFKKYFYMTADYANIALKIAKTSRSDEKQDYIRAIKSYQEYGGAHTNDIRRGGDGLKVKRYFFPLMMNNHLFPEKLHTTFFDFDDPNKTEEDRYKLPTFYFLDDEDETFKISTLQFILLELIVLFKMIFTRRDFADFLLPIPIAIWAGYLLLTN